MSLSAGRKLKGYISRNRSNSIQTNLPVLDLEADKSPPNSHEDPIPIPRPHRARSISACSSDAISTSKAAIIVHQNSLPIDQEDCAAHINTLIHGSSQTSVDGYSDNGEEDRRAIFVEEPEQVYQRIVQAHPCYDAVPTNSKVIVFDTDLSVKKAFYALIWNCARAALLWDKKQEKVIGILSITDFIRVLLKFQDQVNEEEVAATLSPSRPLTPVRNSATTPRKNVYKSESGDSCHSPLRRSAGLHEAYGTTPPNRNGAGDATETPDVFAESPVRKGSKNGTPVRKPVERALEEQCISSWRKLLNATDELKPFTTITSAESLYRAAQILVREKIHRLPIVDAETRNPLHILTYKRLLHFLWLFSHPLPKPNYIHKTPKELKLGVWGPEIITVYPDTPLLKCLQLLIEKNISGLPVVSRVGVPPGMKAEGRVLDMYTRFDAIGVAAERQFDDLRDLTVDQALSPRRASDNFEGVISCSEKDTLAFVIETLVSEEVHRVVILDSNRKLSGLVTVSDVVRLLVLQVPSGESSESGSSVEDGDSTAMRVIPEEEDGGLTGWQ